MKTQKLPSYRDSFGQTHNNLFCPGPNWQLNACVGRNGGRKGRLAYALGYFEAGRRLVRSLRENRECLDLVVYPLVMAYRQGIENAQKYLANELLSLCGSDEKIKATSHKLMENWKIIRQCLEDLGQRSDDLSTVEANITAFDELDPAAKGMPWRYPWGNDGQLYLQDTSLINVEVFAEEMEFLIPFYIGCVDRADACRSAYS